MDLKKHCELCDHQILNLKEGSICGLTKNKPYFNNTCTKIHFNKKLKYKLEEILIEYEDLKRNKSKVYKNVIFTLIVGFIIVFCGFFYWKSFINDRYLLSRSHLEYLIIVVGLFFIIGSVFIKKSLHKYKFYKNSLHYNEKSKEQMQSLLNLYNKKYRYKIKFGKEFNDEQDVFFNIDVF